MRILLIAACVFCASAAQAHDPMQNVCLAPERPQNDQDDVLWDRFIREVDEFRDCVSDRMRWHQRAAAEHSGHAEVAVDAWNDFVRTSLNAPEDFPWGPEVEEAE